MTGEHRPRPDREQADVLTALTRAMGHLDQDTEPDGQGNIHFCLMRRWGKISGQPDGEGNLTLTDRQATSATDASIISHLETLSGLHVRGVAAHWPAPDGPGHCFTIPAMADNPAGFNYRQCQNMLAAAQLLAGPLMELQRQAAHRPDDQETAALAEHIAHADRLIRHASMTMQETMERDGRQALGLTDDKESSSQRHWIIREGVARGETERHTVQIQHGPMPPEDHLDQLSCGDAQLAARLHDNREDGAFYITLTLKDTGRRQANSFLVPGYHLRNLLRQAGETADAVTLEGLTARQYPLDIIDMWLRTNSWYLLDPDQE